MTEETSSTEATPGKPKRKPAAKKAPAKKAAKKAVAKAKPATKKAPSKREATETRNGIPLPRPGGASAAIWGIADSLSKKTRKPATRGDVLGEAEKLGLNAATVATQFARWRQYNGISGRAEA